jgi:mono/diheme cytochrome c family protein
MSTRALLCCFIATLAASSAHGQAQGRPSQDRPPRILADSVAGRDTFQLYCSPCHGRTGKGDGPVGPELRTAPADLSRLAERAGGTFPAERIRAAVTGTGVPLPAHGSTDMPVWGRLFGAFDSDARVRQRIANVVSYIETLQAPPGAAAAGAGLFRTYCASCHGVGGRGDGPVAGQLRQLPPDLTTFTKRNGGVFPSERVRQIIDGRGPGAHGDRDMPVWGDAFRVRSGLAPEAVEARIAAIVRFLQGIQARDAH